MSSTHEVTERSWKLTIHLPATVVWVREVIGKNFTGSKYRGVEWIPEILNPINHNWIELRQGVTRREILDVWRAIGGTVIADSVFNNASVADRESRNALKGVNHE